MMDLKTDSSVSRVRFEVVVDLPHQKVESR